MAKSPFILQPSRSWGRLWLDILRLRSVRAFFAYEQIAAADVTEFPYPGVKRQSSSSIRIELKSGAPILTVVVAVPGPLLLLPVTLYVVVSAGDTVQVALVLPTQVPPVQL